MPRQTDAKIKAQALKLYAQGLTKVDIAKRCGTSYRTIQRWLVDIKPVTLIAKVTDTPKPEKTAESGIPEDISPIPAPLCQLAKIATAPPDIEVLGTFSRNTAIELLRLTGKSLAIVAATLDDPDVRRSDQLKAAQIVLSAVGIGAGHGNVFNSIKRQLEIPNLEGMNLRRWQDFLGKEAVPDPIYTPEELERRERVRESRREEQRKRDSLFGDGASGESSESSESVE